MSGLRSSSSSRSSSVRRRPHRSYFYSHHYHHNSVGSNILAFLCIILSSCVGLADSRGASFLQLHSVEFVGVGVGGARQNNGDVDPDHDHDHNDHIALTVSPARPLLPRQELLTPDKNNSSNNNNNSADEATNSNGNGNGIKAVQQQQQEQQEHTAQQPQEDSANEHDHHHHHMYDDDDDVHEGGDDDHDSDGNDDVVIMVDDDSSGLSTQRRRRRPRPRFVFCPAHDGFLLHALATRIFNAHGSTTALDRDAVLQDGSVMQSPFQDLDHALRRVIESYLSIWDLGRLQQICRRAIVTESSQEALSHRQEAYREFARQRHDMSFYC